MFPSDQFSAALSASVSETQPGLSWKVLARGVQTVCRRLPETGRQASSANSLSFGQYSDDSAARELIQSYVACKDLTLRIMQNV
jgi:hypothetical protein